MAKLLEGRVEPIYTAFLMPSRADSQKICLFIPALACDLFHTLLTKKLVQ